MRHFALELCPHRSNSWGLTHLLLHSCQNWTKVWQGIKFWFKSCSAAPFELRTQAKLARSDVKVEVWGYMGVGKCKEASIWCSKENVKCRKMRLVSDDILVTLVCDNWQCTGSSSFGRSFPRSEISSEGRWPFSKAGPRSALMKNGNCPKYLHY